MPRGPVVASQALILLMTGLVAGGIAGLMLQSRWAMLLTLSHTWSFSSSRDWVRRGPTVDGIYFNLTGIMAFVAGRGFYALVGLFPMTVGAVYGARLAHGIYWPHAVTAIALVAVVALAAVIVRPAGTPASAGPDGEPLAGSIATLEKVELGGHDKLDLHPGPQHRQPRAALPHLRSGSPRARTPRSFIRAGHSSVAFTLDRYGHLYEDRDEWHSGASRRAPDISSSGPLRDQKEMPARWTFQYQL